MFQSLTLAEKDWQEEKCRLRKEIDTLKELNQILLDAWGQHCTENV